MAVRGCGDHSYPSSDPQPGSAWRGAGRRGFLSNSNPKRPAGRRAGGRGGPERISSVREKQVAAAIFENRGKQELSSSGRAQQLRKINHTRLRVTRSPRGPHQQAGCAPITYPQLPPRGVFLGHSRARSPCSQLRPRPFPKLPQFQSFCPGVRTTKRLGLFFSHQGTEPKTDRESARQTGERQTDKERQERETAGRRAGAGKFIALH